MKIQIVKFNMELLIKFFFVGFLFICSFRLINFRNQIYVLADELGYWGIAAQYAGYDWTKLLQSSSYYSFGYSILLLPLFWLQVDASIMYKIAITLNAFMCVGSYLISCKCFYSILSCDKKIINFWCGVVGCYTYIWGQVNYAWPEIFLYFLFWLIFFQILIFLKKPTVNKVGILMVSIIYMFFVHQRTLGVIIAIAIVMLFFALINLKELGEILKEKKIKIIFWCILIAIILAICIFLKKYSLEQIFSNKSKVAINDFSGQVSKIKEILSVHGLINFVRSLLGKYFYLGVATLGVGILGISVLISNIIKEISLYLKQKNAIKIKVFADIFLLLSFFIMISITAINTNLPFQNERITTRTDVLFYGRYFEFILGPILVYGLYGLSNMSKHIKNYLLFIILFLISAGVTQMGIMKITSNGKVDLSAFGFNFFYWNSDKVDSVIIYGTLVAMLIIVISIVSSWKKQYAIYASLIICVFWIYQSNFNDSLIKERELDNEKYVATTVSYIKENKIDKINYIKEENETSVFTRYLSYIQFNLYQSSIDIQEYSLDNIKLKDGEYYLLLGDSSLKDYFIENTQLLFENKIIFVFKTEGKTNAKK